MLLLLLLVVYSCHSLLLLLLRLLLDADRRRDDGGCRDGGDTVGGGRSTSAAATWSTAGTADPTDGKGGGGGGVGSVGRRRGQLQTCKKKRKCGRKTCWIRKLFILFLPVQTNGDQYLFFCSQDIFQQKNFCSKFRLGRFKWSHSDYDKKKWSGFVALLQSMKTWAKITWMDGDISLCQSPGLKVGRAVHELVEGAVLLVELTRVLALVPAQLSILEPTNISNLSFRMLKYIRREMLRSNNTWWHLNSKDHQRSQATFYFTQAGTLPPWDLFLINSHIFWSRSGDCKESRILTRNCGVFSLVSLQLP
jgi:hypothetical protein